MKVWYRTKPSPLKSEGEDALAINAKCGLYGVMDGVTPIARFHDEHGHNGAYLASNILKAYLEQSDLSGGLRNEIIAANRVLRQAMLDRGIDLELRHERWASCIAAAHVTAEGIAYAQLGDCMVIARYRDGSIAVLTENRVAGVSARAKAKREQGRLRGEAVEPEQAFVDAMAVMTYNRTYMANRTDGYGVANGDDEIENFLQCGWIPYAQLTDLLLVSDGMFHPELSLEETLEAVMEYGFDRYVEQVEQAERERGIVPDDRSAVLLSFPH